MTENEEFAHGFHYGDYSGVVFYGPPTNGFWLDRLAVSDSYIAPIFGGILDRGWRLRGGEATPQLVAEWCELRGWAAAGAGRIAISASAATDLIRALTELEAADVASACAGCTVSDCLRCAGVVREYLARHVEQGLELFVEDD